MFREESAWTIDVPLKKSSKRICSFEGVLKNLQQNMPQNMPQNL